MPIVTSPHYFVGSHVSQYVRAKAHREGTIFRKALDNAIGNENNRVITHVRSTGTGELLPVLI